MSTNEPNIIEDEPYQGLYRGEANSAFKGTTDGRLPDRFDLAEILKKTREAQGLSLAEVSEMTRVRRAYLEAFEQAAYDVLPPRAFAIGYVKAYAKALGLDEETLADMYKREVSPAATKLHAPSGASLDDVNKPNYRLYIGAAASLVAAIVIWNVVQRQPSLKFGNGSHEAQFGNSSWAAGVPNMLNGAIFVSQPQPAPRDQDVPVPYVTPGLEEGFASIEAARNANSAAPVPVSDVLQMRKAFNPRGAVYGASPENSAVTIQATKTVNLVVRDPATGTVYFAHSIGAGEAYRLPETDQQNLLIDVSDVSAFEMYYNGEYAGTLEGSVTPIGRINARAAQLSDALDQKQAQAGELAGAPRATSAPIAPLTAEKPNGPIPYLPSQRTAVSESPPATEPDSQ